MENRGQTGNGGGMSIGAVTLTLDQFEAIVKKARAQLEQNPACKDKLLELVHTEIYWCYKQTELTGDFKGFGVAPGAITNLLEIPVPTAAQRQHAESLERQYA
jgi:hypothetical protein